MYRLITIKCLLPALFLTLLCVLPYANLSAQSSQYKNYSVKDGLPSSEVYHVMQDSKGYMWFGTDHGACRFDGYTFKSFSPSNGLADPMVLECSEDYKGRIWFRSVSGKLSYYYHDSIFRLPVNDSIVKILKGHLATSISVDTNDCVYIAGYNSHNIVKINLRNHCSVSFAKMALNMNYIILLPGKPIMGNTKEIVFTQTPIPIASHYYDTIIQYTSIPGIPFILHKDYLWVLPASVAPYNSVHNQAIRLPDGKIAVSSTDRFLIIENSKIIFQQKLEAAILNLYLDKSGRVWITLQDNTPVFYSNGAITRASELEGLKKMRITSICPDNEGGIWLSTLNSGVFYISVPQIKTWNSESGLPGNKVIFVGITPDHLVSMSFEGNDIISFLKNDSILSYKVPRVLQASVTSILFNVDKTIWVGSTFGTYVLEKTNLLHPISANRHEISNGLIGNPDGTIWNNGHSTLNLLKKVGDSIERIKAVNFKSTIYSFCKNLKGGIWLAGMNGLWEYYNDSLINYTHSFPELVNGIESLQEAPGGYLWMAMRDTGVIMKYNNTLLHLTTTNGLLSDFCKCICIDYKGNIWAGSNKGVSHIIVHIDKTGMCHVDAIKNMNAANLNEVNAIACDSNMVYVGTNSGLTSFDMDKIESNNTPPPIYITSILVNNKKAYSTSNTFNLHYDENYISLNFLGITYRSAGNIQYRYKLEGIDTGWIYTTYTSVQYPKLAPGNYAFLVSAMNNDGLWSTLPAKASFIIAPPFWATWWARVAMTLIIAALIYWRIKEVEKREKKKTEVTKQLATFELKELKAQLDPHFLFNSLNTLTHLVEKTPAQAPEFVEELSQFYRYTLLHRNNEFTTLQAEIEQAERYLKLLRIRFGDQLKVTWNIDEVFKKFLVPTNSLQLLLENISKHNVILPEAPLWVEIVSTPDNLLIIKNQFKPKKVPALSNGIGLNSINERYRLLAEKKINIIRTNEYFSVELPLISPKEYEDINY